MFSHWRPLRVQVKPHKQLKLILIVCRCICFVCFTTYVRSVHAGLGWPSCSFWGLGSFYYLTKHRPTQHRSHGSIFKKGKLSFMKWLLDWYCNIYNPFYVIVICHSDTGEFVKISSVYNLLWFTEENKSFGTLWVCINYDWTKWSLSVKMSR